MQANFFAHLTCEFIIDGVSGTRSNDSSFNGFTDQSKIADDIQQFMAGTFVGPYQRFVVNVSQQLGIHVRDSHDVGQLVIVFLGHFTFVDNDGIVQIATLDESGRQQWLDFTDKYKGTAGGNFIFELLHILQCGKLVGDDG